MATDERGGRNKALVIMNKKAKLRSRADTLWFNKMRKDSCEVCGDKFRLQVHHFFPKSQFAHLRYDEDNGVTLCGKCHFEHHSKSNPKIQQAIVAKRGVKWFNKLAEETRENPSSYQTIGYYEEIIKRYE